MRRSDLSQYGELERYFKKLWRDPNTIDKAVRHHIPKDMFYIFDNPYTEQMLDAFINKENVLLIGEPSVGKSMFVLKVCSICNIPLIQLQGDGEMSVIDIIGAGSYNPVTGTGFEKGVLPLGIEYDCWILYDEINMILPEVLARTHSMLDDRRHLDLKEIREILALKETVVVSTQNPSDDGRHVGTKVLSPALLSRMHMVVPFDFLKTETEASILKECTYNKLPQDDIEKMIKVAHKSREAFKKKEVLEFIDTRMLMAWARKSLIFGLKDAIQCTVLSRLDQESFDVVRGLLLSYGIIEATTTM